MFLRWATILLVVFFAPLSSQISFIPSTLDKVKESNDRSKTQDMPPTSCHVTLPSDGVYAPPSAEAWYYETPSQFYFGTDKLWTVLPTDGTWRGPYTGGQSDFVYDNKMPWYRISAGVPERLGLLTIRGKRLDGPAPSFIETNEYFQYNPGGLIGGISIPAYGCWQISGHYADGNVTFTVWVTPHEAETPSLDFQEQQSAPTALVPRVHVDGDTAARALVYKVLPETVPAFRETNTYGAVVLKVVIGTDGRAHDVAYISGSQTLAKAAMEAVRWYQYRLPIVDTEPYRVEEVETTITVLFPTPSD